jgi:hypothetical protein
VSILTYKSLFERSCQALAGEDSKPKSKRLKFETAGAPTVYLAHTIEDWDLASPAAGALAGCGVDIHAEWTSARLLDDFDGEAAERLRARLGLAGSWLVVLVSERTPLTGRIPWVLELGQEVMSPNRFAVLPVRFGPGDWSLPRAFELYPRIEEADDDLRVITPGSRAPLPLSRWLRPSG